MTTTPDNLKPLTKISLNMIPRAVAAIEQAADITGDSRTDVINRAVQLYAFTEAIQHAGGFLMVHNPDGTTYRLELS